MQKLPPLHDTRLQPHDLIGPGEMDLLNRHREKWLNGKQGTMTDRDRATAASILKYLRKMGWYPLVFDKGRIKWAYQLKSEKQILFEKGLADVVGLTRAQCRDYLNEGVKEIG